MSFAIMGNMRDSRLLTYRTTRAVKCLYFDGMSASLMGSGTESQMTFLYGASDKVPSRPFPGPPGHGRRPHGPPPPPGDASPGNQMPSLSQLQAEDDDERPRWNPLEDEYFRARGLCNWIKDRGLGGLGWGFEGIVRMNAGFEMIWCDFNSTSLKLVSNLNISAPLLNSTRGKTSTRKGGLLQAQVPMLDVHTSVQAADEGPHGPGMTDPREPFRSSATYMWFASSAKRYGSYGNVDVGGGETRVRIDACGMFTFYDPKLTGQFAARLEQERDALNVSVDGRWLGPRSSGDSKATALEELMRRRHSHRANHVEEADGAVMYELVDEGLRNVLGKTNCSTTSWHAIANEVVAFYARLIKDLHRSMLSLAENCSPSYETFRRQLRQLRSLTHWAMLPYYEYPPGPHTPESIPHAFSMHSPAAREGIDRCSTQYAIDDVDALSQGERLLSWAVDATLTGICSYMFKIGLGVEREWLLRFNSEDGEANLPARTSAHDVTELSKAWLGELDELMAWLGWVDQWTGCEKGCAADEFCYIPMWPVGGFGWGQNHEALLWHPTCVNGSHYPP
ncbi:uncharacterized protein PV09_08346 [Verruconis gallopava]|uniref:Uncharacterized protein n=1 Tax=Verruconis gallopava TaxID=253628 RepID=A0A0D2ALM6_9PEZI|nr:uncharacterized protein PV09_08346 [Verruconis gallopava]KIV99988.1 hypothetical protein PV09_08346 [Verruconis gallopava]